MPFYTDQQTLNDLRIFGSISEKAVFQVYNQCVTRGGALMLTEMFRMPLSNYEAINSRSSIIRYFSGNDISFPVKGTDFDAIEPYLANTDERTRLSAQQQSLGRKLNRMIAADAQTVAIEKGIAALISLFHDMADFVRSPFIREAYMYAADRQQVEEVLSLPAFEQVFSGSRNAKLSQPVLSDLDADFRFRHRDKVQRLLRAVYLLDVYISVAAIANRRGFVFAVARPGKGCELQMKGVYHPGIKNAVPNDIEVSGSNNVIFLTGANMAGKSTFMKSVSLALFLAHIGFPVAAAAMHFQVLDGIFTTINLPDNLGIGASHFYAEVLRLKKVAGELSTGKRLFIVFDELFRGTNVKDAGDATIAVTEAFAGRKDSIFIISTHIIEAGCILEKQCDNIQFLYLPTGMNGSVPEYTYRLQKGITGDRHGMVIVRNEKILEILDAGLPGNNTITP